MNRKIIIFCIVVLLVLATVCIGGQSKRYYLGGGLPEVHPKGVPYTVTVNTCYGFTYVISSQIPDRGSDGICFGYLQTTEETRVP